jgi:hypothetical protein
MQGYVSGRPLSAGEIITSKDQALSGERESCYDVTLKNSPRECGGDYRR